MVATAYQWPKSRGGAGCIDTVYLFTFHWSFNGRSPALETEVSLRGHACGTLWRLLCYDSWPATDSLGDIWKHIYLERIVTFDILHHTNTLTYLLGSFYLWNVCCGHVLVRWKFGIYASRTSATRPQHHRSTCFRMLEHAFALTVCCFYHICQIDPRCCMTEKKSWSERIWDLRGSEILGPDFRKILRRI